MKRRQTPRENTKPQTRASREQRLARERLVALFRNSPIPDEQLLVNLGLYIRSSVLAKFLYVNELYRRIIPVPGVVMEFGVWWGQNLALFESLRGVYEPYNYTRKCIGFDTFAGYPAGGPHAGEYAVSDDYLEHLRQVLDYHELENVMSHVKKYELVRGDASITIGEYLARHPETVVALAYFDMRLYEPTKACLHAILPHLTRGSVIALDELNSGESPRGDDRRARSVRRPPRSQDPSIALPSRPVVCRVRLIGPTSAELTAAAPDPPRTCARPAPGSRRPPRSIESPARARSRPS